MEIKLKLFNRVGLLDNKSIIPTKEEKIKIILQHKLIEGLSYFAKTKDMQPIEIKNYEFEIENKPGAYDFVIYATKNGEEIKSWKCDTLIIKDLDDKNEVKAELNCFTEDTLKRLENFEKELIELSKKCDKTLELVKKINGIKGEIK